MAEQDTFFLGYKEQIEGTTADWGVNWQKHLKGDTQDTIVTSTWVATGLTIVSSEVNTVDTVNVEDTIAKVWLTGAEGGEVYTVINTVVTTAGRTLKAYFYLTGIAIS